MVMLWLERKGGTSRLIPGEMTIAFYLHSRLLIIILAFLIIILVLIIAVVNIMILVIIKMFNRLTTLEDRHVEQESHNGR